MTLRFSVQEEAIVTGFGNKIIKVIKNYRTFPRSEEDIKEFSSSTYFEGYDLALERIDENVKKLIAQNTN